MGLLVWRKTFRPDWGWRRERELVLLSPGQDWHQNCLQGCAGSPHGYSALYHSLSRKQAVTQLQYRGRLTSISVGFFKNKKYLFDGLRLVIRIFAKKLCRKKKACREVKGKTRVSDVYSLPAEKSIVINNINLVIASCPCHNHRYNKDFGNDCQENFDRELILSVVKNKYQTLWANNNNPLSGAWKKGKSIWR